MYSKHVCVCVYSMHVRIVSTRFRYAGPEEDKPRDMELLDFVTHSPQSNSFLSAYTQDPELAWLWTTKRRRIVFNSKVS